MGGIFSLIRQALAVMLGIVLMLIIYSSLNAVLWRQYRVMTGVLWQGSRNVRDLSPGIQDRNLAWTQDPVYFDWLAIDGTLIDYPLGVTGTIEMVNNLPGALAAAAGLTLLSTLAARLVVRRAIGARRTGLNAAFYRLAHVQLGRARVVRNAVWVFALALPLAGGLAWYVFYDRVQTSVAPNGGSRAVRYLAESFSPRGRDWAFVTLAGLVAASWYAWRAAHRLAGSWTPKMFSEYHERCAGCQYSLEGIRERCPECHLPVNVLAVSRGFFTLRRAGLAGAAGVIMVIAASFTVISAKYEGHVYWPVFHWVTMRGEERNIHPHLYALPNRPVMLRWGATEVWILVRHRDMNDPNDLPLIGYKVADAPVVLVEPDLTPNFDPAPLFVDGRPVLALTIGGMPPIPWVRDAVLHRMPVLVQPDTVRGFAFGEPLPPAACRFLEEVQVAMRRSASMATP